MSINTKLLSTYNELTDSVARSAKWVDSYSHNNVRIRLIYDDGKISAEAPHELAEAVLDAVYTRGLFLEAYKAIVTRTKNVKAILLQHCIEELKNDEQARGSSDIPRSVSAEGKPSENT
jgi:hypothetical protein